MKEYIKKEVEHFANRITNYNIDTLKRILCIYKVDNIELRNLSYKIYGLEAENKHLKGELSQLRLSQSIHKKRNKELRLKIRNLENELSLMNSVN